MISGIAKSVMVSVNTTTPAAIQPGLASGRMTCQKVGQARPPRLIEASSSSSGIAVKAGASNSTANGSMYWTSPISTPG